MKRFTLALALLLTFPTFGAIPKKPVVQLAILLDTSGSMDGLIDQARKQLWRVVNELATAKKDGHSPNLQVALFEYGNDGLSSEKGYIRRVLPLTTDLDRVSEELFALRTNGGSEFCGQVIGEATKQLDWSKSPDDMKLIFIAGNEEFTQGKVDFHSACKKAISQGIIVNTIFCGDKAEGIRTKWKEGADLADGHYMSIDQNQAVADIPAPQDKEIAVLGTELNKTYISYGVVGAAGAARQTAQDANLAAAPTANVQRQVAKAQAVYSNTSWDLVDATKEGTIDVSKMEAKDLPDAMKKMTPEQRKAYVAENAKKRADIQSKIKKLDADRQKYVAAEQKKLSPASNTLDAAVISAVRDVGTKQGYKFP
ncbi:MAG TPA: vWA domain-containing protein [Gemmatimonadaceae bacterium]|nr:vWA domain-containing protein [Gemmatimonadaceae bacterium]